MLKIKSTEKLASSNTQGFCDIERTIKSFSDEYNEKGIKVSTTVVVQSRMFQEKTVQKNINDEIVDVIERKYMDGNDHVYPWKFSAAEIAQIEIDMSDLFEGLKEDEKRLLVFIQLTKTAGENGNGWQGMSNWVSDNGNYLVVKEFSN